MSDYYVRN